MFVNFKKYGEYVLSVLYKQWNRFRILCIKVCEKSLNC